MNEPMRFSDSFQIQKDYQLKSVCEPSYHRMYSPYARTSYQQSYATDELHYSASNISESLEEPKFAKNDDEVNGSPDPKHYTILEPAGVDSKAASVLQDVARDGSQPIGGGSAAAAAGALSAKSPAMSGESSINKSLFPFTHGHIDKGECALGRLICVRDLPQSELMLGRRGRSTRDLSPPQTARGEITVYCAFIICRPTQCTGIRRGECFANDGKH